MTRPAIIGTLTLLGAAALPLAADDLADLREAHEARIAAINAGNTDFAAEQEHPLGVSFSPGSPFASHDPKRTTAHIKQGWKRYSTQHESLRFQLIDPQYLVVGSTGLAWGHARGTHKLVDGPTVNEFRRTLHVYVKRDGKWRLLAVHTSWMPDGSP